jgi:hypothetical protein
VNHRFSCRKEQDDIKTAVCQKTAGLAPTKPAYGRRGIRHIDGLILTEAITWNVEPSVSMQTEKPQVE